MKKKWWILIIVILVILCLIGVWFYIVNFGGGESPPNIDKAIEEQIHKALLNNTG